MRGQSRGRLEVRQPASVFDAGRGERLQRFSRVTHTVNSRLETQRFYRLKKKLMQLSRPFFIAPVTNPDQIAFFWRVWQRQKHSRVCRFMPYPNPPRPMAPSINRCNCFAEDE